MMRLANPEALWLLALVPLVVWLSSRRAGRAAVTFSSLALAEAAGRTLRMRVAWLPVVLRAGALAALVVALARPQSGTGEVRTIARGVAIMLVVDRSYSMVEPMMYQGENLSRIGVVKRVLRDFVLGDGKSLGGRREDLVGLVTFARFADTVAPLSRTHDVLASLIGTIQLTGQSSYESGTAIGEGLALAAARLRRAELDLAAMAEGRASGPAGAEEAAARAKELGGDDGDEASEEPAGPARTASVAGEPDFTIKSKAIILLTDGDENTGDISGVQAARLCAEWGITIYAIGIGAGGGDTTTVQTPFGTRQVFNPMGGVSEAKLRQIAEITGGKYFIASDGESLRRVYQAIDELEKTEIQSVEFTTYKERFWWWAAGAAALLGCELLLGATVLRRSP